MQHNHRSICSHQVRTLTEKAFSVHPVLSNIRANSKTNDTNLKASHISTEKRSEFAATALTLALITHLIIQHIWFNLHLLVNTQKVSLLVYIMTHKFYCVRVKHFVSQ